MRGRCCTNQNTTEKRTGIGIKHSVRVLYRAIALLLLISVPGLSTFAKVSWYLPQSNLGHYLTTATKMKAAHSPAINAQVLQYVSRSAVPATPQSPAFCEQRQETSVPRMRWTMILLRRPPPSEFA